MVPGDREGLSVRSQLPVQAYGDSTMLATTAMSVLQHTLTQLTLQEALTAFRPDFIQQSCERQRSLREKQWERVDGRHRPPPIRNRKGAPQSEKTPKFFFVGEPT